MTQRELLDSLRDVLIAIADLEYFIEEIDFAEFSTNRLIHRAAIKQLEIIGEAVKNLPNEVREQYAEVPWKQITGMRDRLVHKYWDVQLDIVWEAIQQGIPPLKDVVNQMLEDLQSDS